MSAAAPRRAERPQPFRMLAGQSWSPSVRCADVSVMPIGVTGNWLPYVTGGLAVGELKAWDALFPSSGNDFRAGWTVGGGMEVAFLRNWTFKVEYLYVDLGSQQMFNVVPGVPETVSFTANVVRGGINYKFY